MPTIRVASQNCEWMNDWFTSDAVAAAFKPTFTRDGQVNDTPTTAQRLADLIRTVDPDVLAIQEAPSRPEELDLFIRTYLSAAGQPIYRFLLGDTGSAQKIGLLYKPDRVSATLAMHADITGLIDSWYVDTDGNGFLDLYDFTRNPLVIDLHIDTHAVQLIAMHTKSNFVNNGQSLWTNPATRQNYISAALQNRRRISAEAMHTRKYLDRALQTAPTRHFIVLGDMNDGPGLDYFEERYLTHNVTDILVGSPFDPEWIFAHAQHDVSLAQMYTAVFDDFVTGEAAKHLLLDHILLSPSLLAPGGLQKRAQSGTIHHTEYTAVTGPGTMRQDRPSDHRMVSVLLDY